MKGKRNKEKNEESYFFDSLSSKFDFLVQYRLTDLAQYIVVHQFESNALIKALQCWCVRLISNRLCGLRYIVVTCNRWIADFWDYRPEDTARYDNILGN